MRSLVSRKISVGPKLIGFVLAIVQIIFVLAALTLPAQSRDVLFLLGSLLCFAFALTNYAGAWYFILMVLPFIHLVGSMFGVRQFDLIRIIIVGMLSVLAIKSKGNFWREILKQYFLIYFILFIIANLVSAIIHLSIDAVYRSLTYTEPIIFYFIAYYIVRKNSANYRRILRALVIGGLGVSVLGLIELQQQFPIIDLLGINITGSDVNYVSYLQLNRFGFGGRIISTIGQPVYAGIYFIIAFTLMTFYILQYLSKYKSLLFISMPLGTVLIIATGTRIAMLGIIPLFVALILLSARKGVSIIFLGVGGALLARFLYVLVPGLYGYLKASLSLDSANTVAANVIGRFDLTTRLFAKFVENPIIGYGPGLIQKLGLRGAGEYAGLAGLENQYVVILADGGIFAGFWYLLFMLAALLSLWRIYSGNIRKTKNAGLMVLLLLIYYFVVTLTVTSLVLIPFFLVMTLLGATVALSDNDKLGKVMGTPKNEQRAKVHQSSRTCLI